MITAADRFKNRTGKIDGSEARGCKKTDRGQGEEALMQSFSDRLRYGSEVYCAPRKGLAHDAFPMKFRTATGCSLEFRW